MIAAIQHRVQYHQKIGASPLVRPIMADGKWIEDLAGDVAWTSAARHVLRVRLEAVRERMPDAILNADEDIEHVHQLRVSTRRAGAAVRIFGPLLPDKAHRTVRKRLKRIRRAAGEARDWDVFQEMLLQRRSAGNRTQLGGFDFLLGYAQGQRALGQTHLADLQPLIDEYPAIVNEVMAAIPDDPSLGSLREHAVPLLTNLASELEAAAGRKLDDYEELHQVRILGKQLRYAMEIFASCFDHKFREELYPKVEAMQEILGNANDSYVAVCRLSEIKTRLDRTLADHSAEFRKGIETLVKYHQRRLSDQRRRFLRWRRDWLSRETERRLESTLRG
jgi:CHAD domain-containing protein